MIGEVLAAIIPHDDPALGIATAIGTTFLALAGVALGHFFLKERILSKGDVGGMILVLIGFWLAMGGSAFQEYAHLLAVVGAVIAGVGLGLSLITPDMPSVVGFLDEGINSALAGWAVYDAVNG